MLELIGVDRLTQWDVGRQINVDKDIDMVHFSNRPYGYSKNVKVTDGVADVPDMFLTSCAPLRIWAYVGDFEKGYTKIEKIYEVKPKNRPEDYIYTPEEVKTWEKLQDEIGNLADLKTEAKENLVKAINEAAETKAAGGTDISLGLTSAAGVQTIKVKVIDKSGKPTAWEATDMPSWSQISGKPFDTIDGNTLVNRSGTLCVNTTDNAEQDNTRPITSSGVHVICGNINALLQAI